MPYTPNHRRFVISFSDYERYGCPRCGRGDVYVSMSGGGAHLVTCSDRKCDTSYTVVSDGLRHSPIGFGAGNGPAIYPEVQPHPRRDAVGEDIDPAWLARVALAMGEVCP